MVKIKRKTNTLLWVAIGTILLVGITFASIFSTHKIVDVPVYPSSLTTNIDMQDDLSNVVEGEIIINSASFKSDSTTNSVYVRADIRYYVDTTMTNNDRVFLIRMNYSDVATSTGTNYKWVRGEDGFYYLTDTSGVPLQVSKDDTTEYMLCENVTYSSTKNLVSGNTAPTNLKLRVDMQAVNAKNMETTTDFETVASKFKACFGNNYTLGYIVTFDTDNAGSCPAQVFLTNDGTVTRPEEPSKVGYIFKGWYSDSNYNTEYTFTNKVTSNLTLYAKFVEGKTVTITKDINITSVTVTTNGETISSGDLVPVNAVLTIAVTPASGYKASWTITSGGVTLDANATNITANDDIIISVTARQLKTCKVSYTQDENISAVTITSADGETISSGDYVVEDSVLSITITPADGYLANWTIINNGAEESANSASITVLGDVVITATSVEVPLYTFGYYDGTTNTSELYTGYYYVDMGYYPQSLAVEGEDGFAESNLSEVTDETYTLLNSTSCSVYKDDTYKYIKYNLASTSISYSDTDYTPYGGDHYYRVDPVRWLVLGKVNADDGTASEITSDDFEMVGETLTYKGDVNNLLVLSEKVLDSTEYHTVITLNQWSKSYIRTLMNGENNNGGMLTKMFTTKQQNKIQLTSLKTTYYNKTLIKAGGDSSTDKLFLFSCTFGTSSVDNYQAQTTLKIGSTTSNAVYDSYYANLRGKPSELCLAEGQQTKGGFVDWWLRSGGPGDITTNQRACVMQNTGYIRTAFVNGYYKGIRPAFVLNVA